MGDEPEYWFSPWGLPCHWKGWALGYGTIFLALAVWQLVSWVADLAGEPGWGLAGGVPALLILHFGRRLMIKRSPPRE